MSWLKDGVRGDYFGEKQTGYGAFAWIQRKYPGKSCLNLQGVSAQIQKHAFSSQRSAH